MMTITQALEWRYATKKFDATKKLTDAQVTMLLEAARLAPSSFGLQPWRFLVIEDPALEKKSVHLPRVKRKLWMRATSSSLL